jgi:hypothetical protein
MDGGSESAIMSAANPPTVRVGAGTARAYERDGGLGYSLEYEEQWHIVRTAWDPRDDGPRMTMKTQAWDEPYGENPSAEERQRIREGLWKLGRKVGAEMAVDVSPDLPCPVVVGWKRTSEFLVDVHDGGHIEYFEVRRTLVLGYTEPEPYHAVVSLPSDLRWTYPPVEAIAPEARRMIVQRLGSATKKDLGVGSNLPWRITVAGGRG